MKADGGVSSGLREVRSRLGLSQQELAKAAGITRQTIGGIEAGLYAPSAAVALRLARALDCRVEDLFWLEEALPRVRARLAGDGPMPAGTRLALAQVGGGWVARPLQGEASFRTELMPADGVVLEAPSDDGRSAGVEARLLDDPEALARTVVLAGCTPALSLWARSAERWHPGLRVQWTHANSMDALAKLARGEVHAAGIHLHDAASGDDNSPFVRKALGERPAALVNLGVWEEGLLVAPGNPLGIKDVADLAGGRVRLRNRETGAGARLLLDSLLQEHRIAPAAITGYGEVSCSHQEVAQAVASGGADAGVSTASLAAIYGLSFVPLREVRYDLVFLADSLKEQPVRQLLGTLHHRWVRSQLELLGGYRTTQTGEIQVSTPANMP